MFELFWEKVQKECENIDVEGGTRATESKKDTIAV